MHILLGCLGAILIIAIIIGIAVFVLKLLGGMLTLIGVILPVVGLFLLITGKLDNQLQKNSISKFKLNRIYGFVIITIVSMLSYQIGDSINGLFEDKKTVQVVSDVKSEEENNKESNEENKQDILVQKQEDNHQDEQKEEDKENSNIVEDLETSEAEIHFINTGNSDAILIKQGNLSTLIDGGDNDDEGKVVSYLKQQGVTELEYIFATHPHSDHIGGLDAVVNSITVKNIYVSNGDADTKTYSDFINAMANRGLNPSVPLLNSEFKLGTSVFKVLSVANSSDPNNNSIVLLYTNGNDKALLMGDAESEIESRINVEDVDLLKVGHHGSNSSSSSSFIDKIKPEYAVITVGKNNKYGHPHKETMDTLESRSIDVHRSDECGNIVFKSSGNGLSVDCKSGSYNAGESNENSSTSNSSNVNIVPTPTPEPVVEPQVNESMETVYWTPKGKSYHSTKSCRTLSRSKTILSGTQAESGKYDPCDVCN